MPKHHPQIVVGNFWLDHIIANTALFFWEVYTWWRIPRVGRSKINSFSAPGILSNPTKKNMKDIPMKKMKNHNQSVLESYLRS